MNQVLCPAIQGDGVDNTVAGERERGDGGHDGGHPGVEDGGGPRAGLQWRQVILDNLGVGVIQPRENELDVFPIGGA